MAEQSNPGLKALVTGVVLGVASAAFGGYTMFADKTPSAETSVSACKGGTSLTAAADAVKQNGISNSNKIVISETNGI